MYARTLYCSQFDDEMFSMDDLETQLGDEGEEEGLAEEEEEEAGGKDEL